MKKNRKKRQKEPTAAQSPARPKSKRSSKEMQNPTNSFPMVGIGASAGGLEAFEQFFKNMPADSGLAFVLIPHLDPGHTSMMPDLLKRFTRMKVLEAGDGMAAQPDHIYVIPPNKDMGIYHGTLQLTQPERTRGLRMPIDYFLRSLAEDQGDKAICIILSGTGTDGSMGLRAVHGAGGMVMVQEADTAKYEGMPQSALDTGLADYVMPVEKMPEQLLSYARKISSKKARPIPEKAPSSLQKVMMILRSQTGHDFSCYKKSTIYRRIEKRMDVHNLEDLAHYVRYLQAHADEVQMLFKELLIGVTSFFRDPESFEVLKKKIIPMLVEDKPENYLFRIWVPGCATGEEVYSIAIIFREYMDQVKRDYKIQVFGTDIDEDAIRQARMGIYPDNIAIDITPERLKRFLVKEEGGLRIKKEIRENVVFAVQNVIKDAPFTKLDLISCRNLLIYLEPELQNRLIPLFHYSLKPGGFLFLGSSETIGKFSDLFSALDKKWKFFQSRGATPPQAAIMTGLPWTFEVGLKEGEGEQRKQRKPSVTDLTQKMLLEAFVPPSIVVNDKGDILYIHGQTGKFLEPAEGQPSMNILDMARDGLRYELRTALHGAVTRRKEMRYNRLRVKTNDEIRPINLTVRPLTRAEMDGLYLVVFEDLAVPAEKKREAEHPRKKTSPKQERRIDDLEQELSFTKESLQATIEELQAANEELRSTNEEFQSTNEELQSTNEEMETSKEELQSVNEELMTVNTELQAKIEQLSRTESDMKALLDSINIGTIFLDTELHIKRFTAQATKVFNLIPSDIGRPMGDIRFNSKYEDLLADAGKVLETLQTMEKELETNDGRWYLMRIMPSRTPENIIDGVAVTFTDVSPLKKAESDLVQSNQKIFDILESIPDGFFNLDQKWRFTYVNKEAEKLWRRSRAELTGKSIWDVTPKSDDFKLYEKFKKAMEDKIPVNLETFFSQAGQHMEVRAYPAKEGISVYFHEIKASKETKEKDNRGR